MYYTQKDRFQSNHPYSVFPDVKLTFELQKICVNVKTEEDDLRRFVYFKVFVVRFIYYGGHIIYEFC